MNEKKLKLTTGEIYLVRFHPAFGSELKRFRPAIIISSKPTRIDPRFSLISPLTTGKTIHPTYELSISNPALKQPSSLLLWYLTTIDTGRLERKLGKLSPSDIAKMKTKLKQLIS